MEDQRRYMDLHIVTWPKKCQKLVARPTYKRAIVINSDLALVETAKARVKLSKPIYLGYSIIEYAKNHMYDFHYNVIKKIFPDGLKLLFTDTGNRSTVISFLPIIAHCIVSIKSSLRSLHIYLLVYKVAYLIWFYFICSSPSLYIVLFTCL